MASYGVIYDITAFDILGNQWTVEIRKKDYSSGSLDDIVGSATPVKILSEVDDQDVFSALRFVTSELELISLSASLDWFDLFAQQIDYDTYTIFIDYNNSSIVTYLDNADLSDDYGYYPKSTSFNGYEGFHILSKTKITDDTGTAFTGKQNIITLIAAILNKLPDKNNNIRVGCNLYETNHNTSVGVFAQTYIDTETFYDKGELLDCNTVLFRILTSFNCCIFPTDDYWWIIHIPEMTKTVIDYYDYNLSGTQIAFGAYNPRLSLTANSVSRSARIGYIDQSQEIEILEPSRSIITKNNWLVFPSINMKTYFKEFSNFSYNKVPDGWMFFGALLPSIKFKYTEEKYEYNTQEYYPLYIPTQIGYTYTPSGLSSRIDDFLCGSFKFNEYLNMPVLESGQDKYKMKVKFNYRFNYRNYNISAFNVDWVVYLKKYEYNGGVLQNTYIWHNDLNTWKTIKLPIDNFITNKYDISANNEYTTLTLQPTFEYKAGIDEIKVEIIMLRPLNPSGFLSHRSDVNESGMVVKNIETELLFYNASDDVYEKLDDKFQDIQTNYEKNYGKEYVKEIYYGDIDSTSNDGKIAEAAYGNKLYYLDGSTYKPTKIWDYNNNGINDILQRVVHYDSTYQYSTDTYIINADIMGYPIKLYHAIYDPKLDMVLIPLNIEYDVKRDIFSGEFMELKVNFIESGDYLADENGNAILDESGNQILVNY